ncbi:MAG: SpoIIE family protein phosphatase [Candidatus Krumholzibacteria bacterium]|nr:SpoIIE family protein phosphatase [Candidatus Krumholzibacteria bacterium]
METRSQFFVTELVAEMDSMPTLAAQVVSLASDPDCDLGALSKLIRSDNVLTMRFLALANSAAVAHGQEIKNLRGALVRLGIRRVRNVALLMGMHDMAPHAHPDTGLDLTAYWKYCLATASCCQGLSVQRGLQNHEDAWMVGILHGLGVTSLTQHTGRGFQAVVDFARQYKVTLVEAEMRILDFHHGELGARILKEWKLPRLFVDTVEYYAEDFEDGEVSDETAELIGLLRDAITIARAIGYGQSGDHNLVAAMSDLAELLGLEEETLAALATKIDRQVQEMSGLIGLSMPEGLFASALAASQQEVARVGLEGFDASLIKEDLENQMAAAREIQRRILPQQVPEIPGFELAACNHPSRAVSGDTYDFITFGGGARGLAIADVSGKGIPAALLASTLQASIRALALVIDDPGELLAAANRALFASTDDERFATIFLAVLSPDGSSLSYASAGHNPPLLQRADGQCEWLKPAGAPLGMMPEMAYPVTTVPLFSGDLLVAYTDGLTEARNSRDVEFQEQGLLAIITAQADQRPTDIIKSVIGAVYEHVSGLPNPHLEHEKPDVGDDLTMLILKKS